MRICCVSPRQNWFQYYLNMKIAQWYVKPYDFTIVYRHHHPVFFCFALRRIASIFNNGISKFLHVTQSNDLQPIMWKKILLVCLFVDFFTICLTSTSPFISGNLRQSWQQQCSRWDEMRWLCLRVLHVCVWQQAIYEWFSLESMLVWKHFNWHFIACKCASLCENLKKTKWPDLYVKLTAFRTWQQKEKFVKKTLESTRHQENMQKIQHTKMFCICWKSIKISLILISIAFSNYFS